MKNNFFFFFFFWGGGGGVGSGGSQGRCERRSEVFFENSKEKSFSWRGGVGSGGNRLRGGGGQGRCERRSDDFGKIKKKKLGGGQVWGRVGGVRVDVNEELKFL